MEPTLIEGIPCYAPALAYDNTGFHPQALSMLSQMERRNFWYRSRNEVLKTLLRRFLKENHSEMLEVGCGNGTVLSALSQLKNLQLTGADIYLSGVKFAQTQVPGVKFIQIDAENIPFSNRFDALGCFDVLEHIDNDVRVLSQLHQALKKNGWLFITVPQYPWLWSEIDEIDRHKRRYTREELKEKIKNAGFSIEHLNCFAFTVFPLTMLSRFARRKKNEGNVEYPEINISPVLNSLLRAAMRIDEFLYKIHIKLPFGSSLVLVAQKK